MNQGSTNIYTYTNKKVCQIPKKKNFFQAKPVNWQNLIVWYKFIFYCSNISVGMSKAFDPKKYSKKGISESDVTKIKECFDIFDYDGSGNISPEELVNTIRALGLDEQAKQILNIVNNHTTAEELDFGLFLEIFGFSGDSNSESSLRQLYDIFDPNGTGSFGPEDFEQAAASVGESFSTAEVDQMIDYADKDRDGGISYDEFCSVVTREFPKI